MRRLWMIYGLTVAMGLEPGVPDAQAAIVAKERSRVSGLSPSRAVQLVVKRRGNVQTMDVRNDLELPVNAVISLSNMVNVTGAGRGVIHRVIPPGSQVRVATLRKREAGFPMIYKHSFSYAVDYSPPPLPVPAPPSTGSVYQLPWRGGPYRITQGAGGDYSHHTPQSRYAVDVAMPIGTPVVAARGGKVIATRNDQRGHLPYPGGNFVRILHDDGTHAAYLHLKAGSVRVRRGERVQAGALLGESGNTGRSTGPHLHFVVQKEVGQKLRSIPFRFAQAVDALPNVAANDPQ